MSIDTTTVPGARARARQAMTQQVADIATDLFITSGFDATTVDDICRAAQISRTSFFRYFASKEDVVLRDFDALSEPLLEALCARPEAEPVWESMHQALLPLADRYTADSRARAVIQLVVDSPTLATLHHHKLARWSAVIRPELARRLGADPGPENHDDPAPAAISNAAFACLDAAIGAWLATPGSDLRPFLERAIGSVYARPPVAPA